MLGAPRASRSGGRTAGALTRQRVDALVDQLWSHRVTLLVAPAGSGKTTALRHFAERSTPVAWCTADALDMAPDSCIDHIARVVGDTIGVTLDGTSVVTLAAGLDAWDGEQVALIIDDLHVIASTMAESELGMLIDHQPSKLVIAAATRSHPEFDISRLRLDGDLLEITADDLRFRTWEADRLFRNHYDMILGPADVAMLIMRTEGWAAGLQLYRLAARDQPLDARRRLIGELSATRVGRDYLARNVLSGLPADLQSFLIETSALPVLTGPLCDQLTGRTDSAAVLEHLEHNQLFTISIDQRGSYRYHEVLRTHLDACLQQRDGVAGAAAHHRRVGELLEANGMIGHALHAYTRGGNWPAVSRLIVDHMAQPAQVGNIAGDAWIELIPTTIVENDSYLLLARARERTVNGRFAAAMRDYDRAAAGATIDSLARTCEQERAVLDGWSDPTVPPPPGWLGDLRRAAQGQRAVLDASPDHRFDDLRADLVHGFALLIDGETASAGNMLSKVLRDPLADNRVAAMAEFGILLVDALSAVLSGSDPIEPARVDKVASVVERCGLGWIARVTRAALALTTQVDGCDAAVAVQEDCERDSDPWGAALAMLFEGLGRDMRGQDSSAAYAAARQWFSGLGASSMVALVDSLRPPDGSSLRARTESRAVAPMRVYCFDALEVVVGRHKLELFAVRPRALSVLRLLAYSAGRPVHYETLMNSLWPDVDPDAARHSLQVAISALRKMMPPPPAPTITRHGDSYQLELPPDAFCDVRTFQVALAAASAAAAQQNHRTALDEALRAAEVYRGDLLLDEGPAEWVVGPRETLRLDMVRACSIGAEAAIKLGLLREAARIAERGLAVDHYADHLWRTLIDCHERSGDVASADRVRRSWQEMMEDLGVG
jgi:DNA-binding SARP family transcriptional activator